MSDCSVTLRFEENFRNVIEIEMKKFSTVVFFGLNPKASLSLVMLMQEMLLMNPSIEVKTVKLAKVKESLEEVESRIEMLS